MDIVYTIGHSTHPIDEFVKILQAHKIELVADVRTIPRSRFNPQFNDAQLNETLKKHNIDYVHLEKLGGLRRPHKVSCNTGWKNPSFRGFADYMQTDEFHTGLEQLIRFAQIRRTTIMCAEALPWRCHRSLIADALLVWNLSVENIMSEHSSKPHKLTPWAKVKGVLITYPETPQSESL